VERNLSAHTVSGYLSDLRPLAMWAVERSCPPADLDRDRVNAFLVSRQAQGLAARSVARLGSSLRQFLAFLRMEGEGAAGPEAVTRSPRAPRILPRTLTEAQVEALLAAPDLNTPLGVRDRAWIEVLYASGLRVSELAGLSVRSVFLDEGFMKVTG
jgi:integrase/recombinase XerD